MMHSRHLQDMSITRTKARVASLFIACAAWCATCFHIPSACASDVATNERILFSTSWEHGIDPRLQLQRAAPKALTIVSPPNADSQKFLRVILTRNGDYTGVANGTPRAEISFGGFLHFIQGHEYVIQWQMRIPEDFQFDSQQDEVVGQIHQGPATGYPPFALFIAGSGQYEVHNRTGRKQDSVTHLFGTPLFDRGRLVKWKLVYVPDSTGRVSTTELYKDGKRVFSIHGVPNAYVKDDGSYFKLGIYKAHWKSEPSDVDVRTIYIGAVSIAEREREGKDEAASGADSATGPLNNQSLDEGQ
jgi:hypothetical protein